jgi:hypothetical protein
MVSFRNAQISFRVIGVALIAALLGACSATKYTVDDGRAVKPELLANIELFGRGERLLRPAIAQSAKLKDKDCDRQWELPFSVATSQGWEEVDRVAWVRALGVDERLTVVAIEPAAALKLGDRLVDIDGYTSANAEKLLTELARLRDRGRSFKIVTATGQSLQVDPYQVCRGYVRLAAPNSPQLQDYHWLLSFHPLEVVRAELSSDEALWIVLWTQGMSEEGGLRMKTYHYGTSILSSLYNVATLASGLKGAAIAAEMAIKTAQKAAATVASEALKAQLIEQAKSYAAGRIRDELGKQAQTLTQAQVVASMQQIAANKGMLGGISRVAATIFDRADAWAYKRMALLGANPLAGFSLHQKMLEGNSLMNALAFDPDRMTAIEALAQKDGRKEEAIAILKGIRPETLVFDISEMPLASSKAVFRYEEVAPSDSSPFAFGLVDGMLNMPDTAFSKVPINK